MDKCNTRYQPPCADPRGSNTRPSRATGHTLGHSTPKVVHIEPTLSEKSPTDPQIFWRCVLVSLCCLWGSWVLECRLSSLIAAEDKEDDLMGRTVDEGGLWTPGFTSPPPLAPCCLHLSLTFCLVSISPLPYSNGHWQLLIGGDKTEHWRWERRIFHTRCSKWGLTSLSHPKAWHRLAPYFSLSKADLFETWGKFISSARAHLMTPTQPSSRCDHYQHFTLSFAGGSVQELTMHAAHAHLENMMLLLYPPECWGLLICLKSRVPKLEHALALLGGLLRHKLGSSLLYFWLVGPGESWRIWFQPMNRCGWYEVTVDSQWSCKTLGREGAYARATHRALRIRALISCCP